MDGIPDGMTLSITTATPTADNVGRPTLTVTEDYMFGGRLAEKDAMGSEKVILNDVDGYAKLRRQSHPRHRSRPRQRRRAEETRYKGKYPMGRPSIEASTEERWCLPALYGGGARTHQVMVLLSAADDFGNPGKG